jgi:hypothetical protein
MGQESVPLVVRHREYGESGQPNQVEAGERRVGLHFGERDRTTKRSDRTDRDRPGPTAVAAVGMGRGDDLDDPDAGAFEAGVVVHRAVARRHLSEVA